MALRLTVIGRRIIAESKDIGGLSGGIAPLVCRWAVGRGSAKRRMHQLCGPAAPPAVTCRRREQDLALGPSRVSASRPSAYIVSVPEPPRVARGVANSELSVPMGR